MSSIDKSTQPRYWRSQDELVQSPEFKEMVAREFPESTWDELPPATRRQFLKVMGGSLALAGLTACRWPEEEIVPFSKRAEGVTPGVARQFATSFELGGSSVGILATSYDGRPIKLEGNPLHPDSLGGLSATAQALVLELYDPDRSRQLIQKEQGQDFARTWDEFAAFAADRYSVAGDGSGLAVLSEEAGSPSVQRLRSAFLERYPAARWVEFDPLSRDFEREGMSLVFGAPMRPVPSLASAKTIACFGADPLHSHPAALRLAREFAAARNAEDGEMVRLHVAETSYSTTGAAADHRLAVPPSELAVVFHEMVRELTGIHGVRLPSDLADGLSSEPRKLPEQWAEFISNVASDLVENAGECVVLVGAGQAPEVHALASLVNRALNPDGGVVSYVAEPWADRRVGTVALAELVAAARNGNVETLLILGGNPAFDAPSDLGFAGLLGQIATTVHLSLYRNETSELCNWHLPRAHTLESWGDGTAWDGTWTCAQPLIAPLYDGKSPAEVIALVLAESASSGHDIAQETFRLRFPDADPVKGFAAALHDGLVADTRFAAVDVPGSGVDSAAITDGFNGLLVTQGGDSANLELAFVADSKVYDGRFANNSWLQELPDPITKVTWDNAALLSPGTARTLGAADGEVIELSAGGQTIEIPVYVLPGHAPNSVSVSLGYGRFGAGEVGNAVGVDVYPLRASASLSSVRVSARPTGKIYRLATTQGHHAIDTMGFEAREKRIGILVREASLEEFLAHPEVIHHHDHHPPLISLWKDHQYEGEQWGMAIDLSTCIGCSACVIACQAENNIPVVGREQVLHQREMHWIRIDRYFKTDPDLSIEEIEEADVVFQPVACVQCEMAPCEQVCPVAATQHTRDGLNAMVYNRCVGTRYCANNCPYKVRRFNFFNYQKDVPEIEQMQRNPDVTVRSRGVMEKCTYCVQRIEAVRISARNDRRPIRDGEIVPACAQTCPTQAIVFGDLNDPESEVSRLRDDQRSYATLAELNIRPRTHYLAKLRNPRGDGAHSDGKESA